MSAKRPKAKKHYRIPAKSANLPCPQSVRKQKNTIESPLKVRICYVRKASESQKHFRIIAKSANFLSSQNARKPKNTIDPRYLLSSRSARKPKNTIDPRWKCEFAILTKRSKAKKHYRSAVKIHVLSAPRPGADPPNDARPAKTDFQRCSKRNFDRKLTWKWTWRKWRKLGPRWKWEFAIFTKRSKTKKHYRSAVKMHVLSAPCPGADPPHDARSAKTGFQRCSKRNFDRKLTWKWTWRKWRKFGLLKFQKK